MNELLDRLHNYAYKLRDLNMLQVAGDIDYIVAWLRSPEWTGGEHLKPNPAGKNTIDSYSHNCPIPFTPSREMVEGCTDVDFATVYMYSVRDIIAELREIYSSDEEQIALEVYTEYANEVITLLGGEAPEPPEPEEHFFNIFVPEHIIGESGQLYATYDGRSVTPVWSISPPNGAIISSSGRIDFDVDGEYTITARYAGMIASATTTLEYKSGWSTETIIDDSGDHPIVNTITTDDENNVTTQTVEVINGEEIYTGYEIQPGGESVTIVDGVDTKVKTFDGHNGFTLSFKFRVAIETAQPEDWVPKDGNYSEKLYTILELSDESNVHSTAELAPGLSLRMGAGDQRVQIRLKPIDPNTGQVVAKPISYTLTYRDDHTYWIQIHYDPKKPFEKFILKDLADNDRIVNSYENSILEFSNDVTATLGYTLAKALDTGEPYKCRQCNLDILEFNISKVIYSEEEIPTVTIDNSEEHKPYLITKTLATDGSEPLIRSFTMTPNPEVTSDEYVFIDEGIVTDVYPFMDSDHGFELEVDVKVDYNDQGSLSIADKKWTIISLMQETLDERTDPWRGWTMRLDTVPSSGSRGQVTYILRYSNDGGEIYSQVNNKQNIPESHEVHLKLIYDAIATERNLSCYDYLAVNGSSTGKYVFYNRTPYKYIIPPHVFPITIGCALNPDYWPEQVIRRTGKFWLKKISFKVLN